MNPKAVLGMAALGIVFASSQASAVSYVSGNASFTSVGDQIGSAFDQVLLGSVIGNFTGAGTYDVNTVTFTAGVNANAPTSVSGIFDNTAVVGGSNKSYSVPYLVSIDAIDTLTLGGNSFIYNGYYVTFNALTLTAADGATATGTLTATVGFVPEPAAWALMIVGFGAIGSSMRRRSYNLQAV